MREQDRELRFYVEQVCKLREQAGHTCMERRLLDHGTVFADAALTEHEWQHLLSVAEDVRALNGGRTLQAAFPIKQCFANAQKLVLADTTGQLRYVEGMALNIIPFHHGWNTMNGKVIDLTVVTQDAPSLAPFAQRVIGRFGGNSAFFGVELDTDDVRRNVLRRRMYHAQLLNDRERELWA